MAEPKYPGERKEPTSADALKRAEEALRASEERHEVLVHELNHRVKNTLAMVQAVARQSFRGVSDPAVGLAAFEGRLAALARAHSMLAQQSWRPLDLTAVLASALEPWDYARFSLDGPPVKIGPQLGVSLVLAVHELCTNAESHGALSSSAGRVVLRWEATAAEGGKLLRIHWEESGGPPVEPPTHTGFGSKLIRQAFGAELDFRPTGLVCTLETRLG